jgi:hypothetical protein
MARPDNPATDCSTCADERWRFYFGGASFRRDRSSSAGDHSLRRLSFDDGHLAALAFAQRLRRRAGARLCGLSSGPWHEKQLSERTGRISREKFTGSAAHSERAAIEVNGGEAARTQTLTRGFRATRLARSFGVRAALAPLSSPEARANLTLDREARAS